MERVCFISPNDQHQRCEPAAEDNGSETDTSDWLVSAAWVCLADSIIGPSTHLAQRTRVHHGVEVGLATRFSATANCRPKCQIEFSSPLFSSRIRRASLFDRWPPVLHPKALK